jgi:hypothetical protein
MREIAKSPRFQLLRSAAAHVARVRQTALHQMADAVARLNESTVYQARNGLGTFRGQIPQEEWLRQRALCGDDCWSDPKFVEEWFRLNPRFRANTTRGTRGQEYAGTRFLTANTRDPLSA